MTAVVVWQEQCRHLYCRRILKYVWYKYLHTVPIYGFATTYSFGQYPDHAQVVLFIFLFLNNHVSAEDSGETGSGR